MRFALMEVKVALYHILRGFEVKPSDKTPVPIRYHFLLLLCMGLLCIHFQTKICFTTYKQIYSGRYNKENVMTDVEGGNPLNLVPREDLSEE